MKQLSLILSLFCLLTIDAQNNMKEELPYREIPDVDVEYTSGTVLARMIDGLGFRFYWATEDLRDEDLKKWFYVAILITRGRLTLMAEYRWEIEEAIFVYTGRQKKEICLW